MKIFEIKIKGLFFLLLAVNLKMIIFTDTVAAVPTLRPLSTAESLASTVMSTIMPPVPSPLPAIPTAPSPVSLPPAPSSSRKTDSPLNLQRAEVQAPPIVADRAIALPATTLTGSNLTRNNPTNGPFNNGSVVVKSIPLNQVHSDPNFKQKVESAWQQISAGDPRSFVNINANSGSVYVQGDEQNVINIEKYIASLDKPVVQVRVDVIILFAQRNYNFDIGIDWSGIYNRAQSIISSGNPFGFVGMGGALNDIPRPTAPYNTGYVASSGTPSLGVSGFNNLLVDPTNFALNLFNKAFSVTTAGNAGNSFVQIPFVFGGADLNLRRLNLVLNAAESESKVKIVSRPSVLTSSGNQAVVKIGQQLPMQQSALNSTTGTIYKGSQVVYKSVGISLTVTPTVGADNKTITVDIAVADLEIISGNTQSNADGIMTNPPTLSDLSVTNKVVLKSGQTTVIGGLAQRTDKNTNNKVPFLYRIPLIGNLFKASLTSDAELEQFIFITPTIVEENL